MLARRNLKAEFEWLSEEEEEVEPAAEAEEEVAESSSDEEVLDQDEAAKVSDDDRGISTIGADKTHVEGTQGEGHSVHGRIEGHNTF